MTDISDHYTCIHCLTWIVGRGFLVWLLGGHAGPFFGGSSVQVLPGGSLVEPRFEPPRALG
jgi:hypothetical protein